MEERIDKASADETRLRELLLRGIRGDGASYEKFLMEIAGMLRAYFRRSVQSRPDPVQRAEDLVQETLLSIHQKRHLWDPERAILPWVYAVARYRMIDAFRQDKRRPATADWEEDFEAFASAAPTQADEVAARDEAQEALESLPERQREILMLAKVEGYELAEIARRMGMSLSAVKVTIHRATKKLRERKAGEEAAE